VRTAKKTAKLATKKASKVAGAKKRRVKTETKSANKTTIRPAAGNEEVRAGTKKAIVLELLRRKQGATTAEITKTTNRQNHTIRAFISADIRKKIGLSVESGKNPAGERF